MFIKIGNLILNPGHIICAEIHLDQNFVRLCVTALPKSEQATGVGSGENPAAPVPGTLNFGGAEAQALIKFLCDPNATQDLCPVSHEVEDYQAYRVRGGDMRFEDYGIALRRQQRLAHRETLTEAQQAQCSQLEAKLLL